MAHRKNKQNTGYQVGKLSQTEACEKHRPEWEALREEELLTGTHDYARSARIALGAVPGLIAIVPEIEAVAGPSKLGPIFELESTALAALQAHVVASAADESTAEVRGLTASARALLRRLRKHAEGLADGSYLPQWPVLQLGDGKRNATLPGDLLTAVALYRKHWEVIEGRTLFDATDLTKAEQLGKKLAAALGAEHIGANRASRRALREMRRRAFTLLDKRYDEVTRLVTYARWDAGDAHLLVPSLYSPGPARAKASKGEAAAAKVAEAKAPDAKAPDAKGERAGGEAPAPKNAPAAPVAAAPEAKATDAAPAEVAKAPGSAR